MDVISKRLEEEDEDRKIAEVWAETARQYTVARHKALAWEWAEFHETQLRNHQQISARIVSYHERELKKYRSILGLEGV
jgi:hypothetical protein